MDICCFPPLFGYFEAKKSQFKLFSVYGLVIRWESMNRGGDKGELEGGITGGGVLEGGGGLCRGFSGEG